jgi:hypothetical protein
MQTVPPHIEAAFQALSRALQGSAYQAPPDPNRPPPAPPKAPRGLLRTRYYGLTAPQYLGGSILLAGLAYLVLALPSLIL